MKVAFPTVGRNGMDDEIAEHFGRAPTYTIIDLENNEVKVVENTSEHMGGYGSPPELLAKEKVDVLICGGIGRKALSRFQEYKIKVFIAEARKIKDVLQDFLDGRLAEASLENGCVH